ncbi:MAG: cupin domain-containing protein [Bdellovibrio sp.]|nr:cupin domain-containing protein [Methylotenera sp.]
MSKISRYFIFLLSLLAIVLIALINQRQPVNSIYVEHNPSAEKLAKLDVNNWFTWKKEPSEFVWQFPEVETIYVTKGEVLVTPDGSKQSVLIKKGDFVTFAAGLRCTWQVTQAFEKQVILADTPLTSLYWRAVFKAQAVQRHFNALF